MSRSLDPCNKCGGELKIIDQAIANWLSDGVIGLGILELIFQPVTFLAAIAAAIGGLLGGFFWVLVILFVGLLIALFDNRSQKVINTTKCKTCGAYASHKARASKINPEDWQ